MAFYDAQGITRGPRKTPNLPTGRAEVQLDGEPFGWLPGDGPVFEEGVGTNLGVCKAFGRCQRKASRWVDGKRVCVTCARRLSRGN